MRLTPLSCISSPGLGGAWRVVDGREGESEGVLGWNVGILGLVCVCYICWV